MLFLGNLTFMKLLRRELAILYLRRELVTFLYEKRVGDALEKGIGDEPGECR